MSAVGAGCTRALYEFWLHSAAGWSLVQPYSSTSTFTWTTAGLAPGTYRFSVWARDASSPGTNGAPPNTYDTFSAFDYVLAAGACSGMTATAAPPSPASVGTQVTVSGNASGCGNPRYGVYLLPPGGSWSLVRAYSSQAWFTWNTAGKPAGTYRFSVWARDASSPAAYDAFSTFNYALATTPCTGMSATASPPTSATVGTTVTITGAGDRLPESALRVLHPAAGRKLDAAARVHGQRHAHLEHGGQAGPGHSAFRFGSAMRAAAASTGQRPTPTTPSAPSITHFTEPPLAP